MIYYGMCAGSVRGVPRGLQAASERWGPQAAVRVLCEDRRRRLPAGDARVSPTGAKEPPRPRQVQAELGVSRLGTLRPALGWITFLDRYTHLCVCVVCQWHDMGHCFPSRQWIHLWCAFIITASCYFRLKVTVVSYMEHKDLDVSPDVEDLFPEEICLSHYIEAWKFGVVFKQENSSQRSWSDRSGISFLEQLR